LCILLEKFKIQIIRPEELSFQQQVSFFSKASFVGGIHGAGLTNMIFMDEESNVLEIKTKSTEKNNAFFTLSSALNHNYYYLRSKDEDNAAGITLDLNELNHQFTALFD
jgi:capsular polysaccharide biosynthesis protein